MGTTQLEREWLYDLNCQRLCLANEAKIAEFYPDDDFERIGGEPYGIYGEFTPIEEIAPEDDFFWSVWEDSSVTTGDCFLKVDYDYFFNNEYTYMDNDEPKIPKTETYDEKKARLTKYRYECILQIKGMIDECNTMPYLQGLLSALDRLDEYIRSSLGWESGLNARKKIEHSINLAYGRAEGKLDKFNNPIREPEPTPIPEPIAVIVQEFPIHMDHPDRPTASACAFDSDMLRYFTKQGFIPREEITTVIEEAQASG